MSSWPGKVHSEVEVQGHKKVRFLKVQYKNVHFEPCKYFTWSTQVSVEKTSKSLSLWLCSGSLFNVELSFFWSCFCSVGHQLHWFLQVYTHSILMPATLKLGPELQKTGKRVECLKKNIPLGTFYRWTGSSVTRSWYHDWVWKGRPPASLTSKDGSEFHHFIKHMMV